MHCHCQYYCLQEKATDNNVDQFTSLMDTIAAARIMSRMIMQWKPSTWVLNKHHLFVLSATVWAERQLSSCHVVQGSSHAPNVYRGVERRRTVPGRRPKQSSTVHVWMLDKSHSNVMCQRHSITVIFNWSWAITPGSRCGRRSRQCLKCETWD